MKTNITCCAALIALSGFLCSCRSYAQSGTGGSFGERALKESAIPIHPGRPGVTPFWNIYSRRFIYAPAFDYKTIPNAKKYRYDILCLSDSSTYSFKSDVPYAALSPVWTKMPVSTFRITVVGISARGDSLGLAGTGQYYRASPFDPPADGYYHQRVMPYDSSAMVALDNLMHQDYINYWLEHEKPDPTYQFYRYPAKIMSAVIVGAVTDARLRAGTEEAKRAVTLAKIVADYLIGISFPEGSPLAYFPPTYYGPRIGRKPKSHIQLYNSLVISAADAGNAYLDLYALTGGERFLTAAKRIADTYLKTQLKNGSWYLYVNNETGKPIAPNIAIPTGIINYFDRIGKYYQEKNLEKATKKALNWVMANPVKTFNWQSQFEDVKASIPYKRQSREQACDLAIYLLQNNKNKPRYTELAEELIRFAEDQFVIWEKPQYQVIENHKAASGWCSKNWVTPSVQEQYVFWMPVARSAGIMIETYWQAYAATKNSMYLAKAKSIANSITIVQKMHDGNYPTMFTAYKMNFWLNSVVYPAKVMMSLENHLKRLKK